MSMTTAMTDDAFAGVRRPLLEGGMFPAACYTDPAFLARETERIFRRDWILVGDTDRVAKPGDWWSFDLAGIPLIIARGRYAARIAIVAQGTTRPVLRIVETLPASSSATASAYSERRRRPSRIMPSSA